MRKTLLAFCFLLSMININAQTGYKVLYDRLGLHLYYKYEYYNTVKIKNDQYDQYKITGYAEYDGSKPIFTPINLGFTYNRQMAGIIERYYKSSMSGEEENYLPYYNLMKLMPNSQQGIEFSSMYTGQQKHFFWVPGSLAPSVKYDTSSKPTSLTRILLNGYKYECSIYILVDKGAAVPEPEWKVHDYNYDFVYVEPYLQKNNWDKPETFKSCLEAVPVGNAGDKPAEEAAKQENNTNNTTHPDNVPGNNAYSNHNEKPRLRSVEELKKLILENLRSNTRDITWTSKYNVLGEQKQGKYNFEIVDDALVIELEETKFTSIHMNEDRNLLLKLQVRFKLKNLYVGKMDDILKRADADPSCISVSGSGEINLLNYQELTRVTSQTLSEGYFPAKLPTWHGNIRGYNRGENDTNFNELNKAVRELVKQL